MARLPPSIPTATLSGSIPAGKMATIVDDLNKDRLKILFVSPERLASAAFRRLLRPSPHGGGGKGSRKRALSTVSLLCVDEAHCLSQVRLLNLSWEVVVS